MNENKIRIVKKKHSFGMIEYHYNGDKLIEKIDYSTRHPWLWKYDSKGDLISLTILENKKPYKKLWLGALGTLLILSILCTKCSSNHNRQVKQTNIQHTR